MRQNSPAFRLHRLTLAVVILLTVLGSQALATIPVGYYDTVDASTQAGLRSSLHLVIDDHTKISYTAASLDTWNVLEIADQDPNDPSRILDVYLNASYQKFGAGNTDYNREHTWPSSFGFPDDGSSNYPYTDCHHLFLCNDSRNSSRSNKPYGSVGGAGTTEYTTEVNDGVGGGSGVYPGWSNWSSTTYWETWIDRRGDVARAQLYMDVRYEGGTHGITGVTEPDLILTDNLALIEGSNTGSNQLVAYMGLLSVLLQWHEDDPVDAKEIARNDAIYAAQGNRNPFIDHPEWVECIFLGTCSGGADLTPPGAPTGLVATAGDGSVDLSWNDNPEFDLAGYRVYRSTTQGGPYAQANVGLEGLSHYADDGLVNDTTYYYVVTADDLAGNESLASGEANATPTQGAVGGTIVWFNEFHYDNDGTDTGEFFELAGAAGQSLVGWTVAGYNGSDGGLYSIVALTGTLPNQQNGVGTLSFNMVGMQNGSPDALALIDNTGTVIEFISYEGVVVATNGSAAGMTSVDVGVSETSVPVGFSLQLGGTGLNSTDFIWQAAMAHTSGLPNTNQTFAAPVANQLPTAVANGTYDGLMTVSLAFSSAGSSDPDGTITDWLWDFGDGNTSPLANPSHTYLTAATFVVTLTVTDDLGGENTDTTSAIIVDPTPAPDTPTILPGAHIASIYPNPFNPATNIRFTVGEPGRVQVEIYSIKGELVRVLLNENRTVGDFMLSWNGTNDAGQIVPSGAYFCRVRNQAGTDVQPLLLLK